jgi:amino acid adenylation domain-containing protein
VFGGAAMSYGELNRKANQLAHYLKARGVGPEVLVGICIERSLMMVVGLLGILKAGGAYVALDPAYPAERVAFMLADSNARVVLTEEKLLGLLGESGAEHICLDRDWEQIEREPETNLPRSGAGENLAYVIYTSGSTGRPKGVGITHRSTAALLAWARTEYAPEELSGVLAATSICFDLSVFELFVPLSYGGQVVLVADVLQLPELDATAAVRLVNTVPSAMAELVRLKGLPETVRTVNLAGEPLAGSLVNELYQTGHVTRVVDLYGPSEDTTYSTYAERVPDGPVTIGRPIANSRVYLLDAKLQPVPVGVAGELYLGGAGLARGYLNRPELTAQSFVPDPFSASGGERLYRTGDLARYRADGQLEYLGRIDNQVKVRGFRIELGEIETVIKRHPHVSEALVIVREDEPDDKRLVAYVVPDRQVSEWQTVWNKDANDPLLPSVAQTLQADLRQMLARQLPEYMTPSDFMFLPAFPLTPNGKVNRSALPAPGKSRLELEQPYVAPRTAIEKELARIWSEVLRKERVGVKDNFFEIGGHSLLATQVISRIRQLFKVDLVLRSMFESPTVATLAAAVVELQQNNKPAPSPIISRRRRGASPKIEQLSSEEVDSLLAEVLSQTDLKQ